MSSSDSTDRAEALRERLCAIVQPIEIVSAIQCFVAGKPLEIAEERSEIARSSESADRLIAALANYLYATAYCQHFGAREPASRTTDGSSDLLPLLTVANSGTDRFEDDWLVISAKANGYVFATRAGLRRYFSKNDYEMLRGSQQQMARRGDAIRVRFSAGYVDAHSYFYFVHGTQPDSSPDGQAYLRFYWNISPATAPFLVRELSRKFNEHRVPFMFKCPHRAADYPRLDAGTLYIRKPALRAAMPVIGKVHAALAAGLGAETPLFTKPVAPGLGFAESPEGLQSFGLHRVHLTARGLWHAFSAGTKTPQAKVAQIERLFFQNGISFERSHLDPWSIARYDFSLACIA